MEQLHDSDEGLQIEDDLVNIDEDAQVGNESSIETSLEEPGDYNQDGAEARNAAERNDPEGEHDIWHEEQGDDDADDVEVRIEKERINLEKEHEIRPQEHGDVSEEEDPEVCNDAQAAGVQPIHQARDEVAELLLHLQ
ncbi:unnamed protein product [Haemonchus placei]|uniref:Uncharacterized protein n=1 Tax=Haemonchus placei TaxID=6290 RepID=A0A0N4X186_HAEPC|nr:unnamed protein product [Haemonchus placei]